MIESLRDHKCPKCKNELMHTTEEHLSLEDDCFNVYSVASCSNSRCGYSTVEFYGTREHVNQMSCDI